MESNVLIAILIATVVAAGVLYQYYWRYGKLNAYLPASLQNTSPIAESFADFGACAIRNGRYTCA